MCSGPMIDMLNHSHDPDSSFTYDNKRKGIVFSALKDIALGQEICHSYSETIYFNQWFLNYGFINTHSSVKSIVILPKKYFKVHPEDEMFKLKEVHLNKHIVQME